MGNRAFAGSIAGFIFCMFTLCIPAQGGSGSMDTALKFTRQAIVDQHGFGYEVFNILVPEKWHFSGEVTWQFPGGLPQPLLTWQASSPDRQINIRRYPEMMFNWSSDPMMMQTYQANMAPVANPVSASDFLTGMFLPWRDQGRTDHQVISQKMLPELAESWRNIQEYLLLKVYHPISPLPSRPVFEAEASLLELKSGGNRMTEQFIVLISRVYLTLQGMYGPIRTVSWNAIVTSLTVPTKNRMETAVPFGIMMHSERIAPRWGIDCTRLVAVCARNMLRRQQQIFNEMKKIGRTQSETGDIIMDGWKKRNDSMDRVYDKFSDYMRGSEAYHDPIKGMTVDVPNRYENAWTNGLEYVFSDRSDFNPNQTLNSQNWTRMNRIR